VYVHRGAGDGTVMLVFDTSVLSMFAMDLPFQVVFLIATHIWWLESNDQNPRISVLFGCFGGF
jgi:hypothetical protein